MPFAIPLLGFYGIYVLCFGRGIVLGAFRVHDGLSGRENIADVGNLYHHGLMWQNWRLTGWLVPVVIALAGISGWYAHEYAFLDLANNSGSQASIEQILADPQKFAGKKVRLSGRLDQCSGWECSICPEEKDSVSKPGRCLALEFQPLVTDTGFGEDEQEKVHRFSSVVLTADFDPECITPGNCLDRQVVLKNATVERVTERRASADGLWLGDTTRIKEISGPVADKVKAAALEAGFSDRMKIKVFYGEPKLVVCQLSDVFDDKMSGSWPKTFESALYAHSTLDFFECKEVRKIGEKMVVQV